MKDLKAFTLAEVLITLGIIGVVAAMTMPVLIQKQNEKATVVKLKKEYSVMSNALSRAVMEYGDVANWGKATYDVDRVNCDVIAEFLNIAKDCGHETKGCLPENYTFLDGSSGFREIETHEGYKKLILADGASVSVVGYGYPITTNTAGEIWIDVNGLKKPNALGKDMFLFSIKADNTLRPHGLNELEATPDRINTNNYLTAAWVITHGNMDYLHCNDLDWKTKTKCK